jgi:hypothetical protein
VTATSVDSKYISRPDQSQAAQGSVDSVQIAPAFPSLPFFYLLSNALAEMLKKGGNSPQDSQDEWSWMIRQPSGKGV